MSTTVIVVTPEAILVNDKKLHEVPLPECITSVLANGGPDMSYGFLKGKKVFELTGPLDGIKAAVKYFTPSIIIIDKIESNDQIPEIPTASTVIIRQVSPQVNLDLLGDDYDVFIPHRSAKQTQITACEFFRQIGEFYTIFETRNVVPEGLAAWKAKVAPQMQKLIESLRDDTQTLTKLWLINRNTMFGFIPQCEFEKYCSDQQRAELLSLSRFIGCKQACPS